MPQKCKKGDGLDGFAQPHLVRQDAVHSRLSKQAHPVYPYKLVPAMRASNKKDNMGRAMAIQTSTNWCCSTTLHFFALAFLMICHTVPLRPLGSSISSITVIARIPGNAKLFCHITNKQKTLPVTHTHAHAGDVNVLSRVNQASFNKETHQETPDATKSL